MLLLLVSATIMTFLSDVHYKDGYIEILQEDSEPKHRCKILSFKTTWFKIYIEV